MFSVKYELKRTNDSTLRIPIEQGLSWVYRRRRTAALGVLRPVLLQHWCESHLCIPT